MSFSFSDFLYYNTVGTLFFITGFVSFEYIVDPEDFNNKMYNYGKNIVSFAFDKALDTCVLYDQYVRPNINYIIESYIFIACKI